MKVRSPISSVPPTEISVRAGVEIKITRSWTTRRPHTPTAGFPQTRTLEPSTLARRRYQRARTTARASFNSERRFIVCASRGCHRNTSGLLGYTLDRLVSPAPAPISVGVATYKRPEGLARLLEGLAALRFERVP